MDLPELITGGHQDQTALDSRSREFLSNGNESGTDRICRLFCAISAQNFIKTESVDLSGMFLRVL